MIDSKRSGDIVTVITPVYNCNPFVHDTINSVMNQEGGNPYYIIIDDASTDGFDLISDQFVEVIRHKENKGEQISVNEGLALVKTKYFMIVNADDPLLPGAISKLVTFMEANTHVVCAYPDYDVIGENGRWRTHVTSREYDFKWMVQHHTWIPSVGSIFRSTLIKTVGYRDTRLRWLGDADYWLRVGLVGPMARVPHTLACWRKREGQASSTKSQARALEHIKVIKKFYESFKPFNVFDRPYFYKSLYDVKAEAICWSYLVAATVTNSKLKALQYGITALLFCPLLLVDIKFWDIFFKRAYFILRR